MELENKLSAIKADIQTVESKVRSIKVTDEATQKEAITFVSEIKARLKRIEDLRKFFTGDLNIQIKKINAMFKEQSEPLEKFEAYIKEQIKGYMDEQDRLAREEAEKIRKEKEAAEMIERKAREEAERKAAEEEKLRRQAEQAQNEEEKAKLNAMAEQAKQEAEKAVKEADVIKLFSEEQKPVEAPQKSVRSEGGLATRAIVWKWEVEDLGIVMRSHPELVQIDEKAVNKLVQSGTRAIAGIRIYQESSIKIKA